ncbi:polysaccharide pyruvyl transferase family protein [Pseudacidovorax sp. NFM-22]|uniref:polysaccharide pyruvyl transferase family protein n=1 Tax=Pseudacidovorax sp. NFM-22 TaxID=2744469 RepID=UPI001F2DC6F9|nr:polysaccharide pyruvyl transferase family protein [Pseudacidovorax sp. NFM-22]
MFPNWGCRATGVALSELLEEQHEIIDRIGVETGNNSGWNAYAFPAIHKKGILPKIVFNTAWGLRAKLPKAAKALRLLDKMFGGWDDFIDSTPSKSVIRFEQLRTTIPRFEEIAQNIRACDAIVINGEGTLIFREPLDRDAAYLCFIMEYARQLKKPYYLLNAMLSESPITPMNKAAAEVVGDLLENAAAVSLRDHESLVTARTLAPGVKAYLYPDALFTWKEKIGDARLMFRKNPKLSLGFGNDDLLEVFDFSSPYICVAGTSLITDKEKTTSSFVNLVAALKQLGMPVLIVQTCIGDLFLDDVARLTNTPIIKYSVPVLAGAAIVSGSEVFVTGRFHPSIMASCGGTPCIFLGSNSHKNKTLQEVMEYDKVTHYSVTPSGEEIAAIVRDVQYYLERGADSRRKILNTIERLSAQAKKVVDLVQ